MFMSMAGLEDEDAFDAWLGMALATPGLPPGHRRIAYLRHNGDGPWGDCDWTLPRPGGPALFLTAGHGCWPRRCSDGGSTIKEETMLKIAGFALSLLLALTLASAAPAADRSAGQVVDDTKITMVVKAKLVADKPSNLTRVSVETKDAVVTLSGEVETQQQKAHAEDLARRADGVERVVNNIRVVPRG
jgi:hyperosmotically inducible protein